MLFSDNSEPTQTTPPRAAFTTSGLAPSFAAARPAITCADVDATLDFYKRVLGATTLTDFPRDLIQLG